MARYATLSHEAGLVPIIEPEVPMNCDHIMERCFEITEEVLHTEFDQLYKQSVILEGMILRPKIEKEKIIGSLKKAIDKTGFKVEKVWGETIEDRGGQITYSTLGQNTPIKEKKKWDPDFDKRKKFKAILDQGIPEFSVRLGGTTSVRHIKTFANV